VGLLWLCAGDSFAENAKRGVLLQAWAPLGGSLGGKFSPALQQQCAAVGAKHRKTWAQVVRFVGALGFANLSRHSMRGSCSASEELAV
jgi:diketogulonate reductase-like aldo/keto reductase